MKYRIGYYLRALRKAAAGNVTQQELAEASGLDDNSISRIERGDREPCWETVMKILKALGVDLVAFGNFITEIDEKEAVSK
jgi:transcriptional regulator with XRE-family HTH domain